MTFVPGFQVNTEIPDNALFFLYHDQRLLIRCLQNDYVLPKMGAAKTLDFDPTPPRFIGSLNDLPCYVSETRSSPSEIDGYAFMGLRSLFNHFSGDTFQVAALANQLLLWNQTHRYCGKCGTATEDKTDERAKVCPKCGLINYPRLSPAIIVAVLKGRRILLARSQRFPTKFYSVLAGFVEPGETLEECVKREVFEEVGIHLKNIRYFGSQPWPFPDSLMIAFTSEYMDGEINTDGNEIVDAGWYSARNLPEIPAKISIARELIDWFSDNS